VVETLSGGQQRKVQLAIAFVGSSNLCFIDEASSGLVGSRKPKSRLILMNSGSPIKTQYLEHHFEQQFSSHNFDYHPFLGRGKYFEVLYKAVTN